MSITRRAKGKKRIVCQFDPAFVKSFTQEQQDDYNNTLDIAKLGNIAELPINKQPTIFEVEHLKVEWEHLAESRSNSALWNVFSTHVTSIENCDIKLEFEEGFIKDKIREEFTLEVVQNIASQIMAMTNRSNDGVFFSHPAGWLAYSHQVKRALAAEKATKFAQ